MIAWITKGIKEAVILWDFVIAGVRWGWSFAGCQFCWRPISYIWFADKETANPILQCHPHWQPKQITTTGSEQAILLASSTRVSWHCSLPIHEVYCSSVTVELLDQRYVLVPAKVTHDLYLIFIWLNFERLKIVTLLVFFKYCMMKKTKHSFSSLIVAG